ncbi:hypothetical protein H6G36_02290 [Anabaena minutissima FACHB-250]|nr:hypothetical protein [Anabaena minutissima FACHB-250]
MSSKFIHLQGTDLEIILDLDSINYVKKAENLTWIHFHGDKEPLTITGETAQKFWRFIYGCSYTIQDDSAAAENKNAETPSA